MNGNILIVDDEDQLRKLLFRLISLEGFEVQQAGTLRSAEKTLKARPPDVILCDVKLPDGNGIDFVATVKRNYAATEIILLTAYGNIPDGVKAMKNGAFDYIVKGDENSRIIPLLHQAVEKVRSQAKAAIKIKDKSADFSSILGESLLVKQAVEQARKIALTDATVLLLGETGTGKEVFANAIHHHSKRSQHALVAINCSAFTRDLLEGELFGHKAGAYTGAVKDKKGLVEMADGGTLFLDEIGELPLELQAKLLRFLETREFIKLGDTKTSKVNVRLIAATNRNLANEIENGHFREDLYYRLNVFAMELPPLRNRPGDIPVLVQHFLEQFAGGKTVVSPEAMQLLQQYNWKGNTRELKNIIQRAVIIADDNKVLPIHLPFEIQAYTHQQPGNFSLASVEKLHIRKMLDYTGGNKTKTAQLLDIGLATLYRKIDEYRIGDNQSK